MKTYEEAVNWITGLIPFGMKPGLKRMEQLVDKLNNPHHRLKFIHVAGTNGKGSTCAFLTKVLSDCGYEVGSFTSPYLERFTNRIQVSGVDIPDDEVLRLTIKIKPFVDEMASTDLGHPTMFEVTTTLALLYFAEVAYPDYVVWETGLGGRLDCTNIVHPIVSVITNVGHDHMEILGNTLALVAQEKAGIIKAGTPVISAVHQPEVVEVVQRMALERKSTLYLMGSQFTYQPVSTTEDGQKFNFQGPFRDYTDIPVSLNGAHQLNNAAVALMTLEVLRQYYAAIVDEEHIISGMGHTKWPGRLEIVSQDPRILLDGAHNPEGAETLSKSLKGTYSYKKLHFMIGMLALKNHQGYLRHILPLVDTLIITEPDFRNRMEAIKLMEMAKDILKELNRNVEIIIEPSWKLALSQLRSMTDKEDLAVVSGTLYLISDVRSLILYGKDSDKGW